MGLLRILCDAHLDAMHVQARKLMQEDELEALADGDELIQARRAGFVFPGWAEGPLNFPPTYKFRQASLSVTLFEEVSLSVSSQPAQQRV